MVQPNIHRNPRLDGQREALREASVALGGQPVALWEVAPDGRAVPLLTLEPNPPVLDLDATLRRWSIPIVAGTRWVGCVIRDHEWCVAPVRVQPPLPPPNGAERRSHERMILELAGLCIGLIERARETDLRLAAIDPGGELARRPGVIAHEVSNPLTAALSGAELSLNTIRDARYLPPLLQARLVEELAEVSVAIRQAVEYLRSVQTESRIARARLERFDLVDLARSCVVLERPVARRHGVPLEFETPLPELFIQGDSNALFRALLNLIRNAVTASDNTRHPVVVTLEQGRDFVRLAVRDSGSGISRANLERIFEPGFTTKPAGAGSGMGLAIVQEIIETLFAGRIEVESIEGECTVFTAVLPTPPQRAH